jgi:hypothetical protein
MKYLNSRHVIVDRKLLVFYNAIMQLSRHARSSPLHPQMIARECALTRNTCTHATATAPLRDRHHHCTRRCVNRHLLNSSGGTKETHASPRFSTAQPLLLHPSNHSLPPIRGKWASKATPNWLPNQADVVGNRQLLDGNQRLSLLLHDHVQEHRGIGAQCAASVSGEWVVAGPSP